VPEGADELAGLERRRKELYRELGRVGDFRRGSLNLGDPGGMCRGRRPNVSCEG
jgi:hypothetical protein